MLTLVVFALGLAAVGFVARLLPGASLLVALMTYALQLLVLAVVVTAIDRADTGADSLSRGWFAAAVIVVTLTVAGGPAGRRHARSGSRSTTSPLPTRCAITPGVSDDRIRC